MTVGKLEVSHWLTGTDDNGDVEGDVIKAVSEKFYDLDLASEDDVQQVIDNWESKGFTIDCGGSVDTTDRQWHETFDIADADPAFDSIEKAQETCNAILKELEENLSEYVTEGPPAPMNDEEALTKVKKWAESLACAAPEIYETRIKEIAQEFKAYVNLGRS